MNEITIRDSQMAKGIAIISMIMLHLFCRQGELPYEPLIWIKDVPLIYYLGLFGDICVPIFCFCSGYAHYLLHEKYGQSYKKRIPEKLLRFMCNYWIVVIIFSVVGIVMQYPSIPGSLKIFLGNLFLYHQSYNGAWWFVITYIFLLILSPLLSKLVKRIPGSVVLAGGAIIYFLAYMFRFNIDVFFENMIIDWFWQQLILLGTSLFGYLIGMIFCKYKCISKLRELLRCNEYTPRLVILKRIILTIVIPVVMLVGHGVIQSLFVAPFVAIAVLCSLFVLSLPDKLKNILEFFGVHSTNVWLIHMFFYLTLFEGLVFRVVYPILIIIMIFVLCLVLSMIINILYKPMSNYIGNKMKTVIDGKL